VFPALALHQLAMSGELPDTRFAGQIMDEVVYPLATAQPPAPARPRVPPREGSRTGSGQQARVRKATS